MTFEENWTTFSNKVQGLFEQHSKLPTDEKKLISKTSLGLSQMINDPGIPWNIRQAMLREARSLLGVTSKSSFNFIGEGNNADVLRFNTASLTSGGVEDIVRAGISVQYDRNKAVIDPLERYRVSANLPSAKWVEHMKAQKGILSSLSDGSDLFVFDTETVGLSNTLGGVHEVSGSTFRFGATGFNMTDTVDANFSPPRLSYGKIWNGHRREYLTLNEHLGKIGAPTQTQGDDFLKALYPVLKRMDTAQVVAGQNVRFDIEQVLQNAMRTKGYQDGVMTVGGENIRELIDRIWSTKIDTPGMLLDTQELAKGYFGFEGRTMVKVAPELLASKQLRPMSLENMLLSTNLVDLMQEDKVNLEEFFINQPGHHSAGFDNQLTAYYLKYMKEDRLRAGRGVGREAGHGSLHRRIRQRVISSYAYTPTVNIANVENISPALWTRMVQEGDVSVGILDSHGQVAIHEGKGYRGKSPRELRKTLMSDRTPEFFIGSVNPLEQSVFSGRTIMGDLPTAGTTEDILGAANIWKHVSGMAQPYEGMLNASGTLSKIGGMMTDEEFATVQNVWRNVGLPFADLTREERILTGALGHAATKTSSVRSALDAMPGQKLIADDLADLGLLHFSTHDAARIAPTGKVALPLSVLNAAASDDARLSNLAFAEDAKIIDGNIKWLNMSALPPGSEGKIGFNVGMNLSGEEVSGLATWLRSLSEDATIGGQSLDELGLGGAKRLDVARALEESGGKWGINVAHLDEDAGRFASGAMNDILQSLIRDTDKVNFMLPYLGTEESVLKSGPVMLNRWLNKGERKTIGSRLNRLRSLSERLQGDILGDSKLMGSLEGIRNRTDREVAKTIVDNGESQGINRAALIADATKRGAADQLSQSALYSKVMKHHVPLGIGAIFAVGLGAWGLKRYRENRFYGETLDEQPSEGPISSPAAMEVQASIDQYGPGLSPRRMDPLATAGVVGNMDTNRTNHTMMGTRKNSSIYSGVY